VSIVSIVNVRDNPAEPDLLSFKLNELGKGGRIVWPLSSVKNCSNADSSSSLSSSETIGWTSVSRLSEDSWVEEDESIWTMIIER
jgi:hypothetical protein